MSIAKLQRSTLIEASMSARRGEGGEEGEEGEEGEQGRREGRGRRAGKEREGGREGGKGERGGRGRWGGRGRRCALYTYLHMCTLACTYAHRDTTQIGSTRVGKILWGNSCSFRRS